MTLFGAKAEDANMYLPLSSCEWSIAGIASKGEYTNTALLSFSIDDNEIVDIRRCFNDITHIFAFGRNLKASSITVTLICFLGKECKTGKTGLNDIDSMKDKYNGKRIYVSQESLNINIDTLNITGFLVGMSVGSVNAANGTSTVTFTFIPDEGV